MLGALGGTYLGARALDKLTGNRSPVNKFAQRFADPSQGVRTPAPVIAPARGAPQPPTGPKIAQVQDALGERGSVHCPDSRPGQGADQGRLGAHGRTPRQRPTATAEGEGPAAGSHRADERSARQPDAQGQTGLTGSHRPPRAEAGRYVPRGRTSRRYASSTAGSTRPGRRTTRASFGALQGLMAARQAHATLAKRAAHCPGSRSPGAAAGRTVA
jgi:hypothetical protein